MSQLNNILTDTVDFLIDLPRWAKKSIILAADVLLCALTTWLAFCLRYENWLPISNDILIVSMFGITLLIPIFIKLGLYKAIYRYSGWIAAKSVIKAGLGYGFIFFVGFTLIGFRGVPRSIGILQPLLFFLAIGLLRLTAKSLILRSFQSIKQKKLALIYGAGVAGRQLVAGLKHGSDILPVGFIDDNPELTNAIILDLPVYSFTDCEHLVATKKISEILLAMPSVGRVRLKQILDSLSHMPVHVKTLPGLNDLTSGQVKIQHMREVEVDEILGRDVVQANIGLLRLTLEDKAVLVTGAGGSIGSELCRQILSYKPKILVLFELNEFALYIIEKELSQHAEPGKIIPVLGSVLDENKLIRIFQRFSVQTVYHTAAYKHVPMLELNPNIGIWNNVFGTRYALNAACQTGVETFVLISTDKAVRPTNVMGCSKRIAELVLQAKSLDLNRVGQKKTRMTTVRFGNVLGSSGSVVPLFREQIKNGGPITVTHPEIIRYFMTIPEAAQLVIQAGAMSEGGDVMVLDMGKPVKILDLAKKLIHLNGLSLKDENNPDGDIEIRFTGVRSGEKLFEELLIGEKIQPTSHPRIMRAVEHGLSSEELQLLLVELEVAIKYDRSDVVRILLKKIVPEFNPESGNCDVLANKSDKLFQINMP